MEKLYEICHWCSGLLIVSLSVVISSLLGLFFFGVIPALRSGISTMERLVLQAGSLSAGNVLLTYWKSFLVEFRRCGKVSLLLAGITLGQFIVFNGFSRYEETLIFLGLHFLLFSSQIFLLVAVVLQEGHGLKASVLYLLTKTIKVMAALLVVLAISTVTFFASFPVWMLTLGLLCYFLLVIRTFTWQKGTSETQR